MSPVRAMWFEGQLQRCGEAPDAAGRRPSRCPAEGKGIPKRYSACCDHPRQSKSTLLGGPWWGREPTLNDIKCSLRHICQKCGSAPVIVSSIFSLSCAWHATVVTQVGPLQRGLMSVAIRAVRGPQGMSAAAEVVSIGVVMHGTVCCMWALSHQMDALGPSALCQSHHFPHLSMGAVLSVLRFLHLRTGAEVVELRPLRIRAGAVVPLLRFLHIHAGAEVVELWFLHICAGAVYSCLLPFVLNAPGCRRAVEGLPHWCAWRVRFLSWLAVLGRAGLATAEPGGRAAGLGRAEPRRGRPAGRLVGVLG